MHYDHVPSVDRQSGKCFPSSTLSSSSVGMALVENVEILQVEGVVLAFWYYSFGPVSVFLDRSFSFAVEGNHRRKDVFISSS